VEGAALSILSLRERLECRWDLAALGEVMLRLDPGEGRIATTRTFRAWEGGGEYNVACGLRKCFGLRTTMVTALADNPVGRLVEDLILLGGVDTSHIRWMPYDGVGRAVRNGLNFTERGFGLRGAIGCSDRGHTAASQLQPDDIDWDQIFGGDGARWFHCGGIFAGLSETTADVAAAAMAAARRHGTVVSYDLNYRPSLWEAIGGKTRAQEVNRRLAPLADVMLGNEEDFTAALGFDVAGLGSQVEGLDFDVAGTGAKLPTLESYGRMMTVVHRTYPNLKLIATTLRLVRSATRNDWRAVCWTGGRLYQSRSYPDLEIMDRVGGGDSFASGLIYGLLTGLDVATALEHGAAHGALVLTTPGDTSMATAAEVAALVRGGSARVLR
jgi:2-dehydro-3-deoxygluconokinase